MTPHQVKYCLLSFFPGTPLSWSQNLEGLFKLTLCFASETAEKQGHCNVWRKRRRGPRTLLRTSTNLDCVFVKTHSDP